ncbi:hypothetical protein BH09SUM1_BH09SUM1_28090 [soil metagenome]
MHFGYPLGRSCRSLSVLPFVLVFLLLARVASAGPATIIVTLTADRTGGGVGVSLREALASANAGDSVTFDNSLVGETITLTMGELLIDKPLVISGPGARDLTISANSNSRVFHTSHTTGQVFLTGVTITGGLVAGPGAALTNDGGGEVHLLDCAITANRAALGGAIANGNSSMTIERCTISNNQADQTASSSGFGGAIANAGAALSIVNSTISENSAPFGAGGIYNASADLKVINCTITKNTTSGFAGGIGNNGSPPPSVGNTILCANTASSAAQSNITSNVPFVTLGGNLIAIAAAGSGFTDGADQDQVGNDTSPLASTISSALANNGGPTDTHALIFPSAAGDGCVHALLTAENFPSGFLDDQRGESYARHGFVDIGAVDTDPLNITVNTGDDEDDGMAVNGISLREALNAAAPDSFIDFDDAITTVTLTKGQIFIVNPVYIHGRGARNIAIAVDPASPSRIFDVQHSIGVADISGVTLTGGLTAGDGGAILNDGAAELHLYECAISNNSAQNGAGVSTQGEGASMIVEDCTISKNHASSYSGGIDTFAGATSLISNCTISGNTAGQSGGGGSDDNSTTTMVNCTIVNNRATVGSGGGIYKSELGTAYIGNTIFYGNEAPDGENIADFSSGVTSLGGNYIATAPTGSAFVDGVNLDQVGSIAEPLPPVTSADLGDFGGPTDTHGILFPSRAVGRGNDSLLTYQNFPSGHLRDQRDFQRLGHVDIGAVEAYVNNITATTNLDEDDGVAFGDGISLREAIDCIAPGGGVSFASTTLFLGPIVLDRPLGISGPGLVDAQGTSGAFELNANADVAFDYVTITRGFTSGHGGAIYNHNGQLRFSRGSIMGNHADFGGGISSEGDSAITEITDSTISANYADAGSVNFAGGVDSRGGAHTTISNSTITGNGANMAGGLGSRTATLVIQSCTIVGNSATVSGGGGLATDASGVSVADSIIQLNTGSTEANADLGAQWSYLSLGGNYIGVAPPARGFENGANGDYVGSAAAPLARAVELDLRANGGPTQTLLPLSPGPAIDTGRETLAFASDYDQRGAPYLRIFGGSHDIGAVEWTPFKLDGSPDNIGCEQLPGLVISENGGWIYVSLNLATSNPLYVFFSENPGPVTSVRGLFDAATWDLFYLQDGGDTGFYDISSSMQPDDPANRMATTNQISTEIVVRKSIIGGHRTYVSVVEVTPGSGPTIVSQYPVGTGTAIEASEFLPVITGYESCATNFQTVRGNIIRILMGLPPNKSVDAGYFDANGDGITDAADVQYLAP